MLQLFEIRCFKQGFSPLATLTFLLPTPPRLSLFLSLQVTVIKTVCFLPLNTSNINKYKHKIGHSLDCNKNISWWARCTRTIRSCTTLLTITIHHLHLPSFTATIATTFPS